MREGNRVLITGATSGIGLAFAERLASEGFDLIMTGRRRELIESSARNLTERYGIATDVVLAELSEEAGVTKVLEAIATAGGLKGLINNAGFGLDGMFAERDMKEHLAMIRVHVEASLRFIHAALPGMIERRNGFIINVSSLGAYVPAPVNGIYGGTKAFLNLFTESLHMETRQYGLRVQALCPGFTLTDFHGRMGMETGKISSPFRWMKTERVVDISLKNLRKGKVLCIPGLSNRLLYGLVRCIPRRLYYRIFRAR